MATRRQQAWSMLLACADWPGIVANGDDDNDNDSILCNVYPNKGYIALHIQVSL